MFIFWILIIIGVYFLFRYQIPVYSGNTRESNAEEILNKRYVNGEIDEDTYLRMKKEISH
jgi:uncharacterized membrane protein